MCDYDEYSPMTISFIVGAASALYWLQGTQALVDWEEIITE